MADLGALISIAETVFKLLQSPVLNDMKNWQSDLGKLNKSVSFIKDMLLDADTKPELSHGEQRWVDELNQVLYEADDLFDEVITIAKQKELNAAGAKFSNKVLDKGFVMNMQPSGAEGGVDIKIQPIGDQAALEQRIAGELAPASSNMTLEYKQKVSVLDKFGKPALTVTDSSNPSLVDLLRRRHPDCRWKT